MPAEVQVYLVDDDDSMHVLHRYLIGGEEGLAVCGAATNRPRRVRGHWGRCPPPPDVVLVDYTLAGMTGVRAHRDAAGTLAGPPLRRPLRATPARSLPTRRKEAGAVAYVEKGDDEALLATIRRVAG